MIQTIIEISRVVCWIAGAFTATALATALAIGVFEIIIRIYYDIKRKKYEDNKNLH